MGLAFDAVKIARSASEKKDSTVSSVGILLFLVFVAGGIIAGVATRWPGWGIAGMLIGLYLLVSVRVADQWEKAAVLRLGRYKGLRGPGIFFIIPVIDKVSSFVDQRIR